MFRAVSRPSITTSSAVLVSILAVGFGFLAGNSIIIPAVLPPEPALTINYLNQQDIPEATSSHITLYAVPNEQSDLFEPGECPQSNDGTFFLDAINKQDSPGDKTPSNLAEIQKHIRTKESRVLCLNETVAINLKKMFDDAAAAGHTLYVTSGYRSPLVQLELYHQAVSRSGWGGGQRVATAFHSEHNFGRAVDLSNQTIQEASATVTFDQTPEGQWVFENGYKYGFVLSYPRGKEDITGYGYEPWHWTFTGIENAKIVKNSGKTLHEIITDDTTEIAQIKTPHGVAEISEVSKNEDIAG